MPGFERNQRGEACLAGAPLRELLALAEVTTPTYVYDLDAMAGVARRLVAALGDDRHVLAYAVKANGAGSILRVLAAEGTGADLVSGAELMLARACGIEPARIVMSGVGKTDDELDLAIATGILAVQAESVEEIDRIGARARAVGVRTRVALRINPSVEADTHAHIATGHDEAKFGIALPDVARAWEAVDRHSDLLDGVGVSAHVGSMLTTTEPYAAGARAVCGVARARQASGKALDYVDFGGGFGVDYGRSPVVEPEAFVRAALALMQSEGLGDLRLVVEPGRSLVAPYGVLVARVTQYKHAGTRRWVILDAGMNDLIRPALYQAFHRVEPLDRLPGGREWRVVGPVCESSDDFGSHALGDTPPDHVVIRDSGAYGFAMASQYNGRALASEVFVKAGQVASVSRTPGRDAWVAGRLRA